MILLVCHANLCRSPMAEHLIRRALLDRLGPEPDPLRAGSAGTHASAGRSIHPFAARVLAEAGIDTTGFRARRLTADLVAGADLVLTATRRQRAACVAFEPAAVRRVFTIAQFGRYAAALPPPGAPATGTPRQRLGALVERLGLVRGGVPVVPGEQEDLADPVHEPIAAFRRCRDAIEPVAGTLAGLIAASPPAAVSAPEP
ncbi:arsenate reductase/protein-tyrosine-phosphatase family protein [Actinoplanes siamensis]|uniref:arsenate reductase/protein-tyrosine-phosphatase family protein n=1 Tax=Actinoplanes siamensis TaxID=1223317 RepID=UPI001EF17A0E|nr:low molecular weight phosphatase family protein [Actinoplanes siamensis]